MPKAEELEQTLQSLRKVQIALCVYADEYFCDCKFGANNIGKPTEQGNGCPEIRTAIKIIEQIKERL